MLGQSLERFYYGKENLKWVIIWEKIEVQIKT